MISFSPSRPGLSGAHAVDPNRVMINKTVASGLVEHMTLPPCGKTPAIFGRCVGSVLVKDDDNRPNAGRVRTGPVIAAALRYFVGTFSHNGPPPLRVPLWTSARRLVGDPLYPQGICLTRSTCGFTRSTQCLDSRCRGEDGVEARMLHMKYRTCTGS